MVTVNFGELYECLLAQDFSSQSVFVLLGVFDLFYHVLRSTQER